jgi:acetylornithine deacetylase/succinyl-diaminopimelate desuccinylase-like protein
MRPLPSLRACLLATALLLSGAQRARAAPATSHSPGGARHSPEFLDFLKLPNVMFQSSADMRRNADWVEAAFRRHGFTASQLPDNDTPMVFAQWGKADPRKKTVLFYAHMDGQAVFPRQWDTPPWTPTLRRRTADGNGKRCRSSG